MPFTTPEQFIMLALLLFGGWLIGYASAPSPRKWKRRARAQSDKFTAYHTEAEDRLRAANQRASDLNAEAEALRADHAEAERTIAGLRAGAIAEPIAAVVADAPEPSVVEAEPVSEPVEPVAPEPTDSSAHDALTRIHGIDGPLSDRLSALGVARFEDLENLSTEDEMALEQKLALPVGYIARAQWRTQAALLRAGQDDEHAARFAPVEPAPVA